MEPAARSVVARLHVISMAVWVMWTVLGAVGGAAFVISRADELDFSHYGASTRFALVVATLGCGAVGCFVGYIVKVIIDWARQVLVLLGQIARK